MVALNSGSFFPLTHPENVSLAGIDGLYFHRKSLIAIQIDNNRNRVIRFFLDNKIRRVERARIIESGNPVFQNPTTGVIVADTFYYIANSQLTSFERNKIFSLDKLNEIYILKTRLSVSPSY